MWCIQPFHLIKPILQSENFVQVIIGNTHQEGSLLFNQIYVFLYLRTILDPIKV